MTFKPFTLGASESAGPESKAWATYTIDLKIDSQAVKQSLLKELEFLNDRDIEITPGTQRLVIRAKKYQWPTIAQSLIALDPSTATKVRQIIKESFTTADPEPTRTPGSVMNPPAPQLSRPFTGNPTATPSEQPSPGAVKGLMQSFKKSWPWLVAGGFLGAGTLWAIGKAQRNPSEVAPTTDYVRPRRKRRRGLLGGPMRPMLPKRAKRRDEERGSAILRDRPFGSVDEPDETDDD